MKSLGKNAFYNVVYKCLNILFPLVTVAYVSRVLLPVGVGKVAAAQNVVTYFVVIASLGLPVYGVKRIAECNDNREKASRVFSELFIINTISSIICSAIYILMVLGLAYFDSKIVISLVVGIQLFANIINIDWLYQGFEEYKYIMYRSLSVKFISLIAVFLFIHDTDDYVLYALITALSFCANFIFNISNLHKYVELTFKDLGIIQHMKPVLTLLASVIAIELYTLTATTILAVTQGDDAVGYYSNASKAVAITRTMIAAVCAVFLPRLNFLISHNLFDEFEKLAGKGMSILINTSLPVAVAICILADDFITILFGPEYQAAILAMRILCISIVTIAISNFMGYQILVTLGKEKIIFFSTIMGAVINIGLNVLLINRYSLYGAAIASVVTEGLIAIYQYYHVKNMISIKASINEVLSLLIPTLLLGITILIVRNYVNNMFFEVGVASILGILVFLISGKLLGNKVILLILNKIH